MDADSFLAGLALRSESEHACIYAGYTTKSLSDFLEQALSLSGTAYCPPRLLIFVLRARGSLRNAFKILLQFLSFLPSLSLALSVSLSLRSPLRPILFH